MKSQPPNIFLRKNRKAYMETTISHNPNLLQKTKLGTLAPIDTSKRTSEQRILLQKYHSQSPRNHNNATQTPPPPKIIQRPEGWKQETGQFLMKTSLADIGRALRNTGSMVKQRDMDSKASQSKTVMAFPKAVVGNQTYSYYVDKGNNHELVRKILQKRSWLIEQLSGANVNFRWKPTSKDLNFSSLAIQPGSKRLVFNHIEAHKELTTKQKLYANVKAHCIRQKINFDSFIPQTFILNIDGASFQQELKDFIDEFLRQKHTQQSKNFWIVKPPDLNRGQGIQICNDLKQFISHLLEFCKIKQSIMVPRTVLKNVFITYPSDKYDANKDSTGMTTFNFQIEQMQGSFERQIIIQKYLESPLLYKGRKFDFRVWVLVDHQLQYYFFREGYLRLSCEPFDLSTTSVKNLFVHLTNNAIQKNHNQYSKYELGNQLSFPDLQNYCNIKQNGISVRDQLVPKMKELVKLTFNSVQDKFQQCSKKFQFEIYGYDFMVDSGGNLWLIEINTNPCIEESSPLLQKLIPRMLSISSRKSIDDAFRLTIDKIMPPFKSGDFDRQLPDKVYEFLPDFHVPGYNDNDILWDYLGKF